MWGQCSGFCILRLPGCTIPSKYSCSWKETDPTTPRENTLPVLFNILTQRTCKPKHSSANARLINEMGFTAKRWLSHPDSETTHFGSNNLFLDNESANCMDDLFPSLWGTLFSPAHHFSGYNLEKCFPILKKYHLCFGVKHSPGRKTETNTIECDIEVETSDHPAKYWTPEIFSPGWGETQGLALWKQYWK